MTHHALSPQRLGHHAQHLRGHEGESGWWQWGGGGGGWGGLRVCCGGGRVAGGRAGMSEGRAAAAGGLAGGSGVPAACQWHAHAAGTPLACRCWPMRVSLTPASSARSQSSHTWGWKRGMPTESGAGPGALGWAPLAPALSPAALRWTLTPGVCGGRPYRPPPTPTHPPTHTPTHTHTQNPSPSLAEAPHFLLFRAEQWRCDWAGREGGRGAGAAHENQQAAGGGSGRHRQFTL